MNANPREFYSEKIPEQFNRSFEQQGELARTDTEAQRIFEEMSGVTTSIRILVDGEGGGDFALDIRDGRMTAADSCAMDPFVTIRHDVKDLESLIRESGDSALGFLGGLAGLAGEMRLTRSRIENLDGLQGTARLELTGGTGFRVDTHFGNAPLPNEPHCTIRVDDDVYRDLRTGSIPAQEAFMTGKIAIEGDMQMAMELALAALSPD